MTGPTGETTPTGQTTPTGETIRTGETTHTDQAAADGPARQAPRTDGRQPCAA